MFMCPFHILNIDIAPCIHSFLSHQENSFVQSHLPFSSLYTVQVVLHSREVLCIRASCQSPSAPLLQQTRLPPDATFLKLCKPLIPLCKVLNSRIYLQHTGVYIQKNMVQSFSSPLSLLILNLILQRPLLPHV